MSYEKIINSNPMVMVEFFASWCPHCQRMHPVVDDFAAREAKSVRVFTYDVDKYPKLTQEMNVTSYPTFILYENGQEVWRKSGEMPEAELIEAIKAAPVL